MWPLARRPGFEAVALVVCGKEQLNALSKCRWPPHASSRNDAVLAGRTIQGGVENRFFILKFGHDGTYCDTPKARVTVS